MSVHASVVVPTYRRRELLDRCLAALMAQTLRPAAYEVIVADDANDPALRQWLIAAWPRVRYVGVRGSHGPAAARNRGCQVARGYAIAFTDDDCIPAPGWLRAGLRALKPGVAAVAGRLVMPLPAVPTDYEKDAAGLTRGEFVTANCFCRRDVFRAIGGFDERFRAAWREDSDLFFGILRHEGRVVHAPDALVTHPVRSAYWGVSVTQQKKSMFDALLFKKHPVLFKEKISPGPPLAYYTGLMALFLAGWAVYRHYPATALMAFAVWLLVTAAFVGQRLKGTSRHWRHRVEMAVTSALIPPVAIFWRLCGACRFRVWFL